MALLMLMVALMGAATVTLALQALLWVLLAAVRLASGALAGRAISAPRLLRSAARA